MVQMILAELPRNGELMFYSKGDTFALWSILPILQFGCFQLFLSISPVAFARGWQVKRMTKSDYFYSFSQQIVPENRTQDVHTIEYERTEEVPWKRRWAEGIRRQPHWGHSWLGRGHRSIIWGTLTFRYNKDERKVHSWLMVGKPYDLPEFLQCSHSSWAPA